MTTNSNENRLQDVDDAIENEVLQRKLELLDMRLRELTVAYDDLILGIDWFMTTVETVEHGGTSPYHVETVFALCREHFRRVQEKSELNFTPPAGQPGLPSPYEELPY